MDVSSEGYACIGVRPLPLSKQLSRLYVERINDDDIKGKAKENKEKRIQEHIKKIEYLYGAVEEIEKEIRKIDDDEKKTPKEKKQHRNELRQEKFAYNRHINHLKLLIKDLKNQIKRNKQ